MEYVHDFKRGVTVVKYAKSEELLLKFIKRCTRVLIHYDRASQDVGQYFNIEKVSVGEVLDSFRQAGGPADLRSQPLLLVDLSFSTDGQLGFLLRELAPLENCKIVLFIDRPLNKFVGGWKEWGEVLAESYEYLDFASLAAGDSKGM